ncbi:hypothetical protein LJR220_002527 [Bradyrhizobium sp. LjRoot220]|uniref:hypothetical protein n=1 Tax=Bradyrhizobium sp. LjRoot220 TaxID=3342284 RepID=UPI003ECE24A8
MRHEITALYYAALRRRYGEAARRIDELSPRTRTYLEKRSDRPSVSWTLPDSDALRGKATREEACRIIQGLLSRGGKWQPGRLRGDERRPQWVPELYAPTPEPHPPKRQAEHALMLALALIYWNATGRARRSP